MIEVCLGQEKRACCIHSTNGRGRGVMSSQRWPYRLSPASRGHPTLSSTFHSLESLSNIVTQERLVSGEWGVRQSSDCYWHPECMFMSSTQYIRPLRVQKKAKLELRYSSMGFPRRNQYQLQLILRWSQVSRTRRTRRWKYIHLHLHGPHPLFHHWTVQVRGNHLNCITN